LPQPHEALQAAEPQHERHLLAGEHDALHHVHHDDDHDSTADHDHHDLHYLHDDDHDLHDH